MKVKVLYRLVFLITILFAQENASAQKSSWYKIKKADRLRSFGKIDNAVKKYESVLKDHPSNTSANFQLGKIYLLDVEDFGKADKYLKASIASFSEKDSIYMAYYYLAETQKLLGNYPNAIENYEFFKAKGIKNASKSNEFISEINVKIDECKLAETAAEGSKYTFIQVINLGENVNSNLSEYCSVFLPEIDKLLYTARYRDSDKEKRFMDFKFYEGGYSISDTGNVFNGPSKVSFNENVKSHFSVVSKTTSGDTVIFYKDNKLWLSKMVDGNLTIPVVLPEQINRSYYQPHGVFSPDNKKFVFSSSEKKIQLDLYQVDINSDQTWGAPQLMTENINTKYNEDSPFFSKDGKTLYFSSNKPGGFGNYDIYFSKLENNEWGEPNNIGLPINSAGEDIFFSQNDDKKTGFLSSNRGGGFGAMDIYMFTEQPYPNFDCDEYLAANNFKGKTKISVLDEVVVNEVVRFDVTDAKLEDATVTNIFWKVDDQILKLDNPMLTYTFSDTGAHTVSTQIYGKNLKTDEYVMDCSMETFQINAEGPLFLEIEAERMVEVNKSSVIDAETFYLGENKKIIDYVWFVDGVQINNRNQSYRYSFSDTGYHDLKVVATIDDKARNEVTEVTSTRRIFVYDDSHEIVVADNGDAYIPGIELYDNKNSETGKINALKANVFGVPDDRRVFYSWYIDNTEIKGRQTELLTYDFEPLTTITVKAIVMNDEQEAEFTLEASKVIPQYDLDLVVSDKDNENTDIIKPDLSDLNKVDGTDFDINPVYFMFDKYYLTTQAKAIIDENIKALKANPSLKILVEGNTDAMGPASYNIRLSEKRAKQVYQYLISKGLDSSQIVGVNSNGEKLPKAANTVNGKDNPKGRQENRRVDFKIVKN